MQWNFGDKSSSALNSDRQALMEEIQLAHRAWENARHHLDWVESQEEIDYAIFALAAAEKKYEMLLRRAKQMEWSGQPFAREKGGA